MFKEAVGDLNRLRQILQIVVKHGFGDVLGRARVFERLGLAKPKPADTGDRSVPQRLARMLNELGPTFIKIGQIMSTRPDILPEEYQNALRCLQDQAAPFPFDRVVETIKDDFGSEPDQLFSYFNPEPIASASIAQVHRATTRDGQDVVVKIKRPGIDSKVRSDLDILYYLAHLLEAVFEETGLYEPVAMVREFDRAIAHELNLQREAEHLQEMVDNFAERKNMVVPQPLKGLSSRRVLTMSHLEGDHLDDVEPGSERARQAALNLIEGTYQQVFEDGFFHADPHPGNLRFLPDGRVGLLDFGQVGRLTTTMRSTLVLMGLGVFLKEPETLARLVYRIGSQTQRIDLAKLKEDIQQMLDANLHKAVGEVDTGALLHRLLDLSMQYRIRIPPEYALVTKALGTIDGTVRVLHPELEPATVAAPYVKRLMADRFSMDDVPGGLMRGFLQLSGFLNDVPQQLSQILLDIERSRLTVNVRDEEVPRLIRNVRFVGIEMFWGMIATGLLIGSLPPFMQEGPVPPAAYFGLGGAGFIALYATLNHYLRPMVRKLRLKNWLERRWGSDDNPCQ